GRARDAGGKVAGGAGRGRRPRGPGRGPRGGPRLRRPPAAPPGPPGPPRHDRADEKRHHGREDEGHECKAPGHQSLIIFARNCGSSQGSTPSARAFSSLLPASRPQTTTVVFLLTELAPFAPRPSSS